MSARRARIIEYRDSHGGFRSLAELAQVEGIGEKPARDAPRSPPAVTEPGSPSRAACAPRRSRPWHVAVGSLAAGLALAQADSARSRGRGGALACLAWLRAPGLAVVAAGLLLLGSAAGDARLRALDHALRLIGDGRAISARAHLLTHPRPSAFGASAEARIATGPLAGARVLLRFADRGARPALPHSTAIGAELALAGWLRRPLPDPDASFDFAAHLRRRGIAGELMVDRIRVTGRRRGGIAGALDRLRGRAERAVSAGLPRDGRRARPRHGPRRGRGDRQRHAR